jgi:Fe2+ or Zn2+ uptake regulation protein
MTESDPSETTATNSNEQRKDSDSEEEAIEDARFKLRTTKHAEEVVRELAQEDYQQPSKMLPDVKERTDISRSNFYNLLGNLEGILVKKVDGPGRATLYTLTDAGETVAKEFGLAAGENTGEQAETVINITEVPAADALKKIMKHKGLEIDDIQLVLDRLRKEEQDTVNSQPKQEPVSERKLVDDT